MSVGGESLKRSVVSTDFLLILLMPKSRAQKKDTIASLQKKFTDAKAVVFTNFDGLSVKNADALRSALREAGIEYTVAKRKLVSIALTQAELKDVPLQDMKGGIGIAFGYADEVAPAKTLATFAKKAEALKLVGGIVDGAYLDTAAIKQLATMPSKEELLVKLLWLIQYPTTGFVNVLAGSLRKFLYALNAIKDSKA